MDHARLNFDTFVGERIAEARKVGGMTQEELASKLGFKDRQILSNIEKGIRQVSSEELMLLTKLLGQSLDYFTDPFILTQEKKCFAWRVKKPYDKEPIPYAEKGWNMIAAYLRFSEMLGREPNPVLPQLVVKKDSNYDYVRDLAGLLVKTWKMGETPATELVSVVRDTLGIELFFVDAPDEVSGASFRNDRFCAILINANHSLGRRNFSLAHELFHILSWTTLHPDYVSPEEADEVKTKSEKLANTFAAALLMPPSIVADLWKNKPKEEPLRSWLEETAPRLQVSPDALFYQLLSMRRVKKQDKPDLMLSYKNEEAGLRFFSGNFVRMINEVLQQGRVSVRKVLKLLDLTYEGLDELFASYHLPSAYNL